MNYNNQITKWFKLILGFALIGFFVLIVFPLLSAVPLVKEVVDTNKKYGIEAETLFYTETAQFGDADNYMQNAKKYKPNDGK